MIDLYFEVDGDVQLARSLSRFSEGVKDMRPAFNQIVNFFWQIERKQFDSEGSYGSGGWAPLSEPYATFKAKNFGNKGILQRSGRMMQSLIGDTADTVKEMSPMKFRVGTKVPYAIYHYEGTKNMVARKQIQLTESDKTEWVKIVQRWLVNMAKEAGLQCR